MKKDDLFKKLKEFLAVPVFLLIMVMTPSILRIYDPTTGGFDLGVLQNIPVTMLHFSVFIICIWSIIKVLWRTTIYEYFKTSFVEEFKTLTSWQKIKTCLFVYFVHLALIVLLNRSLFEMRS